jgi:hypothetical protein
MNKLWLLGPMLLVALSAWAADDAGMIKIARGAVGVERGGQRIAAAAGMPVFAGDLVITGEDGSVGITLRDSTLLSAGPRSTLVLNRFVYNTTTSGGALDTSLNRGTLAVVSGKITKTSPGSVQFRTPSAILGVRGTEFVIDAGPGKED